MFRSRRCAGCLSPLLVRFPPTADTLRLASFAGPNFSLYSPPTYSQPIDSPTYSHNDSEPPPPTPPPTSRQFDPFSATPPYPCVRQVSLLGSILSNELLVLGFCFFCGGLIHSEQHFSAKAASINSSLLILLILGLSIPAAYTAVVKSTSVTPSGFLCNRPCEVRRRLPITLSKRHSSSRSELVKIHGPRARHHTTRMR